MLEAQLKVQLFQHAQRRVVLTPAGWEFYPKAKQLLELYDDAVNCAQAAELNANPPKRHLLIGHQNMPLQMLGFDLFAATEELSTRFSPLMYSCANRKDIGRALLNGEIDLSLQIECAEIAARGLHFYPAVYMPEIGIRSIRRQRCPRTHSIGAGGKISVDVCWNTGAITVRDGIAARGFEAAGRDHPRRKKCAV